MIIELIDMIGSKQVTISIHILLQNILKLINYSLCECNLHDCSYIKYNTLVK